jgi:hypothetical protein
MEVRWNVPKGSLGTHAGGVKTMVDSERQSNFRVFYNVEVM